MSADTEREFDQNLVDAAECLEDAYGLDEAIAELKSRRQPGEETPRVNEALAYLKKKAGESDD